MNDSGDIVFTRPSVPGKRVVVLWQDGVETIIDPGAFSASFEAVINNAGVIAFAATSATGQQAVFLASPVPEPTTLLLGALSSIGLMLRRKV